MVTAQGGQSEAAILLGVLLAAGPEIPLIDQMLGQRQHAIASQAAATQVGEQMDAPAGQVFGQAQCPVVLLFGPLGLPSLVVQVLAATGGVGANCLNVAVLMRTDPNLLPRGRNDQCLDPRQRLGIVNRLVAVSG